MPTTAHGYEYPAGGDDISSYPAAAEATADVLETMVKHFQSGRVNVAMSGSPVVGAQAVTFPVPFDSTPTIVAGSEDSTVAASAESPTPTGFTMRARRIVGSSAGTGFTTYIAHG